jgi:hypothetical protein
LQWGERLIGAWSRKLTTLPNFPREFTKAKQVAFPDRELRYLRLLVGRPVSIDMENHRP